MSNDTELSITPQGHVSRPYVTVGVVVLLVAAIAGIGVASVPAATAQEDPTPVPATYYGNVTIGGEPAPAGTTITATIDGEVRGSITIDNAGQYGGPTVNDERLVVNGTQADSGAEVTFRVNGEAVTTEPASVFWESATDTRVDLAAESIPTAQFDLTLNETASTLTVTEGSNATVAVDVTNTGNATGMTSVTFTRNGSVVERTNVSVDLAATTTLTFTTRLETAGVVPVTVSTADTTVPVSLEATTTEEASSGVGGGGGSTEAPAFFEVTTLEPADRTVTQGETFDISVTIENTGERADRQTVELRVAGETVASQEFILGGDRQRTIELSDNSTSGLDAGDYDYGVYTEDDNQTATLTIELPDDGTGDGGDDGDGGDVGDGTDDDGGDSTGDDGGVGDDGTDDDDNEQTDDGIPGFGTLVALVALIAAALLVTRRNE